jgi:site-specific recombinase XerD
MKITHNLSIKFWIRKTQATEFVANPTIYCRITLGNQKTDFSTNFKTAPSKWNHQLCRIKDSSLESQQINSQLDELTMRTIQLVGELKKADETLSLDKIKDILLRKPKEDEEKELKPKGVRYVMHKYIEDVEVKHSSKLLANGTLRGYKASVSNLNKFLTYRKIKGELKLNALNREFFYDFETFLLAQQRLKTNSTYKVIKHIRHMFNFAQDNGWIDQKIEVRFNVKYVNPPRPLLTLEELKELKNHRFDDELMNEARDIFLFTCFTGFAYSEVKAIEPHHICDIEGKSWVIIQRKKTGNEQRVMLLPQAIAIIDKYQNHYYATKLERILPVRNNHFYNKLLKQIQQIMGFKVKMTSHLGRHVMASTIALSNHMPIETLSKILGHSSLKSTTIYAKVLDSKIIDDFTTVYTSLVEKDFA